MARTMKSDPEAAAFRAVVTTTWLASERSRTEVFGPYATVGTAKAQIARERRYVRYLQGATVTGYVERSATQWVRVEP